MRLFYRKCTISVTVFARLHPPLLFSVKHIACHVPHTSRITTSGAIFTETFFCMSSEISQNLVTPFLERY